MSPAQDGETQSCVRQLPLEALMTVGPSRLFLALRSLILLILSNRMFSEPYYCFHD